MMKFLMVYSGRFIQLSSETTFSYDSYPMIVGNFHIGIYADVIGALKQITPMLC